MGNRDLRIQSYMRIRLKKSMKNLPQLHFLPRSKPVAGKARPAYVGTGAVHRPHARETSGSEWNPGVSIQIESVDAQDACCNRTSPRDFSLDRDRGELAVLARCGRQRGLSRERSAAALEHERKCALACGAAGSGQFDTHCLGEACLYHADGREPPHGDGLRSARRNAALAIRHDVDGKRTDAPGESA